MTSITGHKYMTMGIAIGVSDNKEHLLIINNPIHS